MTHTYDCKFINKNQFSKQNQKKFSLIFSIPCSVSAVCGKYPGNKIDPCSLPLAASDINEPGLLHLSVSIIAAQKRSGILQPEIHLEDKADGIARDDAVMGFKVNLS